MFEVWSLYSATLGCYPEVIIFSDRKKGRFWAQEIPMNFVAFARTGLYHIPTSSFEVESHHLVSPQFPRFILWFSSAISLPVIRFSFPRIWWVIRHTLLYEGAVFLDITPNAISKATKVWIQYLTCSFKPDRTIPRSVVYSSLRPPPSSLSTVSQIHSLV